MQAYLLVAAGGAAGAAARYGVGAWLGRLMPGAAWPWGTFAVNALGGLLMGLLVGWLALRGGAGQESLRLLAGVGVLGGFTTFSAYSLELILMLERRQFGLAAGYFVASTLIACAAVAMGLFLMRRLFA
ncbi:fluoride efflux transporter CrcB [Brevundimonas sp. 2R-24]|uniref:Fluoride-specific ion channel FluC n=1 Tax=Peiella sedimenti TaxID=3061083 RepID=A0ABT8SNW9_9CAUL|nr:fluoride efflux transporter CrcB [Caulobacteraceae bacterium XZ-24]